MHFKWNYEEPTPEQQKSAKELADKLSMSPILAQLLIHRGITTESAAKRFFLHLCTFLFFFALVRDNAGKPPALSPTLC